MWLASARRLGISPEEARPVMAKQMMEKLPRVSQPTSREENNRTSKKVTILVIGYRVIKELHTILPVPRRTKYAARTRLALACGSPLVLVRNRTRR
jgi:hypothetical protein